MHDNGFASNVQMILNNNLAKSIFGSFEDAAHSWQKFYQPRCNYWYILNEEQCILVKPFGKDLGNSLGKYCTFIQNGNIISAVVSSLAFVIVELKLLFVVNFFVWFLFLLLFLIDCQEC